MYPQYDTKHIVSTKSLPCRGIVVRIDKSADFRVVISALQVVQPCFGIVDIAAVAEGVHLAQGGGEGAGGGKDIAVIVMGILGGSVSTHRAVPCAIHTYSFSHRYPHIFLLQLCREYCEQHVRFLPTNAGFYNKFPDNSNHMLE